MAKQSHDTGVMKRRKRDKLAQSRKDAAEARRSKRKDSNDD